jgi:hypothetical protein
LELSKPGLRTTMTADSAFTWDVNPSIRPGTDGRGIEETWTLKCPGRTVPVTVGRGETANVSC